MDRLMVYPGAIPLDTDILSVERNVMKALGWLTQATLGASTGVVGLACTPTVPASMVVNVGPGALWSQEVIDQSNFGSLPADASPLMKMGILAEASGTNFTLTAPSTSGQSVNYLIEAAFVEEDENPVVLPYVNPANPAQPFTGPNNTGTAQNTIRAQSIALQLKEGVAANTGTQVTPNVDAGYVGLYVITVNFGQTSIIAANITEFAGAPFNSPPFASLAGNANQTFAVGNAEQSNQAVALGQFPYTGGMFSVPRNGVSGNQYILFGSTYITSPDQYVPFAVPFPNGCSVIVANDTGAAINTIASYPVSRFGMNVYAGHNGIWDGLSDLQYIAIGY